MNEDQAQLAEDYRPEGATKAVLELYEDYCNSLVDGCDPDQDEDEQLEYFEAALAEFESTL